MERVPTVFSPSFSIRESDPWGRPEHNGPPASFETSVWALAQHHGIPTYFLDWTSNPIVAAYFATLNWKSDNPTDIAVWAFNEHKYVKSIGRLPWRVFGDGTIRPGHVHNKYLGAQSGLFTQISTSYDETLKRWIDADSLTERGFGQISNQFVKKVVLKAKHVPEFSALLKREGISQSTYMPTLDNVASEVFNSRHS
ncbi:FRG domain-containing protein [Yoonia sp. SS1-5]|uniref:FRG domain-containing protein n=1 Tax=Yoonia rhodophyticola TaxID=3137370 RepID=A0AAN0MIK2_9RHOB